MIDIHTHILPGLDDGAGDLDEALAMARAAAEDGVAELVATPHAGDAVTQAAVGDSVARLQQSLDDGSIPVRLHSGIEVWLSPDSAAQCQTGYAFPIAGGCYVLIELPLQMPPTYLDQAVFSLQVAGLRPILAHPERYSWSEEHPEVVSRLVSRGVLGQLTGGSLLGAFGPKAQAIAEQMLARGLVHVIASDAHSAIQRPPVLSAAAARASALIGKERAMAMVTAVPANILAGLPVEVSEPEPLASKRRWFWRR